MRLFTFFLTVISIISFSNRGAGQSNSEGELFNRYKIFADKTPVENEYKIRILDYQQNREFVWGVVANCYANHGHFSEFHDSTLYVIREFQKRTPVLELRRELWKYSRNSKELLVSSLSLDFRVSNTQKYLAYTKGLTQRGSEDIDTLFILNLSNNNLLKINIPETFINKIRDSIPGLLPFSNFRIDHLIWATNAEVIWGVITQTCAFLGCFSFNCNNNTIEVFLPPKNIGDGFALNPNNGILVYSNCPFIFEIEGQKEFIESNKEIFLYKYNLFSRETTLLDTAHSKCFRPRWISENILEYSNPRTNSRDRIILNDK